MRKKRDKYIYVDTPLEIIKINNFWKSKLTKIKDATELFMFNPDILTKEIQERFNITISSVYFHFYRLKQLGLIYKVGCKNGKC